MCRSETRVDNDKHIKDASLSLRNFTWRSIPVRSSSGPTTGSCAAAFIFTDLWDISTVTFALLDSVESLGNHKIEVLY